MRTRTRNHRWRTTRSSWVRRRGRKKRLWRHPDEAVADLARDLPARIPPQSETMGDILPDTAVGH